MELHCILGPTGAGKTSQATALARKTGAPVIVMDRIQAYSAFAVGSGRPFPEEIAGTERIYLSRREVPTNYPPEEARVDLMRLLKQQQASFVILEGGSLSLWHQFVEHGLLLADYGITYEYICIDDDEAYEAKIKRRIFEEMLQTNIYRPSMLDEADLCWDDPEDVCFMRTIRGYDIICALCETYQIRPRLLTEACSHEAIAQLMMKSHKTYSLQQTHVFTEYIIPRLIQYSFQRT